MTNTKIWLNILLDESGSMGGQQQVAQTIEDFNKFIAEHKKIEDAQVLATLTVFSDEPKHLYIARPIEEVPKLSADNYNPGGCTALYDAIHASMETVDQSMRREDEKTGVLFLVITDGGENASRKFVGKEGFDAISKIIQKHKKEKWQFVFIGADVDTWQGDSLGFSSLRTKKSNSAATYRALSATSRLYAKAINDGEQVDSFFELNAQDFEGLNE